MQLVLRRVKDDVIAWNLHHGAFRQLAELNLQVEIDCRGTKNLRRPGLTLEGFDEVQSASQSAFACGLFRLQLGTPSLEAERRIVIEPIVIGRLERVLARYLLCRLLRRINRYTILVQNLHSQPTIQL